MLSKQQRHENELLIFNTRHEASAQHIRDWLRSRQDELNERWPSQVGDELLQMQGEAKFIGRLIKLIEYGPTIKPTMEGQHG